MKYFVVLCFVSNIYLVAGYLHLDWDPKNPAFDQSFYDRFLDPELCQEQLSLVRNNPDLALRFIESGLRVPRGITQGNLIDLGNYFQCIGINENVQETNIVGKYCTINVDLNQELQIPELPGLPWLADFSTSDTKLRLDNETLNKLNRYKNVSAAINRFRSLTGTALENLEFTLAVCVPKVCTTKEWMEGFTLNVSAIGFQYTENYCRMGDDKPWAPADTVATVVLSILGLLTLTSTSYDLWHAVVTKSEKKQNPLLCSFSLYTNGHRLTKFTKNPGALECVDGIRALSMAWVILGHSFSTLPAARLNLIESVRWTLSIDSTWVTAAPIGVDTFFMISGMLLVYTTAGKFTGMKLIKNLHVFYLNRILRLFPLLAACVLIQASFLYRLSDGPAFDLAAHETNKCRMYWWTTLLYVQNYFNTWDMCLAHTWYLAIDMHMYLLSPLILFWVLSDKKIYAWTSMIVALLIFLVSSTIYNFTNDFPGAVITATRGEEYQDYMIYYYLNTLTRAAPFFVGMLFGYLLHLWRGKKIVLPKISVLLIWICIVLSCTVGVFSSHPMKNFDWDNQIIDSLINTFSRTVWAVGTGWIVVTCVHGYAGPINWFLSHEIWKMPSRLSYAMYLFHFQIMFVTAGSVTTPFYFTVSRTIYRFFSEYAISLVVGFAVTIFFDSPFSTIFKILLGGGAKKPVNLIMETKKHELAEPNGKENYYAGSDLKN